MRVLQSSDALKVVELFQEVGLCHRREDRGSGGGLQGGLDATEGAVRYRLRRQAEGAVDRRAEKAFKASAVGEVIAAWVAVRVPTRPDGCPSPHLLA